MWPLCITLMYQTLYKEWMCIVNIDILCMCIVCVFVYVYRCIVYKWSAMYCNSSAFSPTTRFPPLCNYISNGSRQLRLYFKWIGARSAFFLWFQVSVFLITFQMDQVMAKVLPNESFPQRWLAGYNSFAFQRFLSTFLFQKCAPVHSFCFLDILQKLKGSLWKQWEELLQWFQNVSTRVKRKLVKLK